MLRLIRSFRMQWILAILIMAQGSGCAKTLTRQAINRFNESLDQKDYAALKLAVSDRFEGRALRREEAVRDLQFLKIPTGKVKIIGLEEVSKNEVRAKVELKEKQSTREVVYTLQRDPKVQRWVVDDVTLTQDSGRGQVTRSAIEQLDLVMSVRDFIDSWNSGERDRVLAVASPELRSQLEPLPEKWLNQLATHIASQTPQQKSLKPDARLKDNKAVVQVGSVLVQFELHDDRWYVRDAALKDDQQTVRSALNLAKALHQSKLFLDAYAAGDKEGLAQVSTSELHNGCLSTADISQVKLPITELFEQPYEARQQTNDLDLILKSGQGAVLVSLVFQSQTGSVIPEADALPRVMELTLVDDGSRESKRLSSIFLHETVVQLFAEALIARDVQRLQSMSTLDFREKVWARIQPDVARAIPMPEIEPVTPQILNVTYAGATTEVTVSQGRRALTYVLQSAPGRMDVSDVLVPAENRPSSLKVTLEHVIPVYEFVAGMAGEDIARIRQCSAESFNAMIWQQLNEIPQLPVDPVELLTQPLSGMHADGELVRLSFGSGTYGADVLIRREDGLVKINDIVLLPGPQAGQKIELLASMRRIIMNGLTPGGRIVTASAEQVQASRPSAAQRIQQAIDIQ